MQTFNVYPNGRKLDTFTRAYIECALWSSTDEHDEPMDSVFGIDDLADETLTAMVADCEAFQRNHADDLSTGTLEQAGHDFWLTRNGHGAGFWDGDWANDVGRRLTDAAHVYGECTLYAGDDGRIYMGQG
jgi:hypothetical protein